MKLSEHILRKPLHVAFGQALQGGGITSIDLVATRNATAVTMTASDGSAAPIAGADASNAGVMTVADKARLDGLPDTTTQDFASRLDGAAAVIGAGVSHIRTAGYANGNDAGGALYKRVAQAPSHPLQIQSGDGAFWELMPVDGAINVRQAGAVGDGVTDDFQAFLDAIEAFAFNVDINQQSSVRVIVPEGEYFIGSTLNIHTSVIIEGQGVGAANGGATVLTWPADTTGIVLHRVNTTGQTTEVPTDNTTKGGDGTIIRNLTLEGSGTFGAMADGVWMRTRGTIEQCVIRGFARDGIHIEAGAGTGGATEGNANNWHVRNCRIIGNKRNGMYVDGADTNAGVGNSVDASSNGRWGIFDSSFLGNTYIGCHCATNGLNTIAGNSGSSKVHYNGPENGNTDHRYGANISATEADLVATVPGTDETVWMELDNFGTHTFFPTWLPGQPVGFYFHGGPYLTDGANARNTFVGCYIEADQSPAQIVKPTQVLGGLHGASVKGDGFFQDGNIVKLGNLEFRGRDDDVIGGMELNFRRVGNNLIQANVDGDHVAGTQFLGWDNVDKSWALGKHANLDARIAMKVTTDLTANKFGRGVIPKGGFAYFPRGFFLGNTFNGRFLNFATAAPLTGSFARGDLVLNIAPSATGTLGWVCVTSGTPGTWTPLAVVSKADWDTAQADIADLQTRVTALEAPA